MQVPHVDIMPGEYQAIVLLQDYTEVTMVAHNQLDLENELQWRLLCGLSENVHDQLKYHVGDFKQVLIPPAALDLRPAIPTSTAKRGTIIFTKGGT